MKGLLIKRSLNPRLEKLDIKRKVSVISLRGYSYQLKGSKPGVKSHLGDTSSKRVSCRGHFTLTENVIWMKRGMNCNQTFEERQGVTHNHRWKTIFFAKMFSFNELNVLSSSRFRFRLISSSSHVEGYGYRSHLLSASSLTAFLFSLFSNFRH